MLWRRMAGTPCPPLQIPKRVRVAIEKRARSRSESHEMVRRAQVIVLACQGIPNAEIARRLGHSETFVRKWRRRVEERPKVSSLLDAPRSGRPATIPVRVRCELVKLACSRPADRPKAPFEQVWTRPLLQRELKTETGYTLSLSEITRTLRCSGLRPHRVRQWIHSPDPDFRPKVEKICSLYSSAPAAATVLCVDEKTGMQALEHAHALHLGVEEGVIRREFEYVRHGTSTLLAAFDVRTGRVFGQCRRRTAKNLVAFMDAVAKRYPKGQIYIVWDNLNVHKGPRWQEFNRRHGHRFHFVYTPLHASWVNQVEIWFSILARRVLKHASFANRADLEGAVRSFIAAWNRQAHPFRWTFRGDFEASALPCAA